MGQKTHPTGFRIGVYEDWRSRWYANKHEFSDLLVEDFKIRKFIKAKYSFAGIPRCCSYQAQVLITSSSGANCFSMWSLRSRILTEKC